MNVIKKLIQDYLNEIEIPKLSIDQSQNMKSFDENVQQSII